MPEHRNSLQAGYQLHWYVIKRILGQGGFGITYLAEDTNLDQEVAIKEYLPIELAVRERDDSIHPVSGEHGEQFSWGLDRFMSEARTLAQFKHANIVRVLTVFPENNTAYMVMEYEHGKAMSEILQERKTIPEDELKSIFLPILDGLQQVHESGFIHRDIKPPNIFIRADGTPVLLDFGSARQSLGQLTHTLTSMVSPGFAPFEQYVSKSDKQGPWTDIYGLGATLYRSVVGRSPAEAMDRSEALLHTSRDSFVGAAEIAPEGYSTEFLRAIDHALAFKAEERPQSLSEWREELAGLRPVSELPTQVSVPTTGPNALNTENQNEAETVPDKITIKATASGVIEENSQSTRQAAPWYRRPLKIIAVLFGIVLLLAILDDNKDGEEQAVAESNPHEPSSSDPEAAAKELVDSKSGMVDAPVPDSDAVPTPAGAEAPASILTDRDRKKFERLKKLLARNPDNDRAKRELRKLFTGYEQQVREAAGQGDYLKALSYLEEMLELAPANEKILELKNTMINKLSTQSQQ